MTERVSATIGSSPTADVASVGRRRRWYCQMKTDGLTILMQSRRRGIRGFRRRRLRLRCGGTILAQVEMCHMAILHGKIKQAIRRQLQLLQVASRFECVAIV